MESIYFFFSVFEPLCFGISLLDVSTFGGDWKKCIVEESSPRRNPTKMDRRSVGSQVLLVKDPFANWFLPEWASNLSNQEGAEASNHSANEALVPHTLQCLVCT